MALHIGTMYFTWNQVLSQWEEETFGINTDKFVTNEGLETKITETIKSSDEVKTVIKEVSQADIQWNQLN